MTDGTDHTANAIQLLKDAEAELSASSLPHAARLVKLVAFVRGFVEADRDGQLDQFASLFDSL